MYIYISMIYGTNCFFCFVFQLFDVDNHVNKESSNYIFTTEGHLIPVQYQGFQKHRSSNFKSTRRKDSGIVEVDAQHSNITKNVSSRQTPVLTH